MTNNYYTPELEELYVGYELEWKMKKVDFQSFPNNEYIYNWNKHILTLKDFSDNDLANEFHNINYSLNEFRTKYLDAANIESLGFKYDKTIRNGLYYIKDNIGLIHIPEDNILMIYKVIEGINQNEMLFQGKCKSINELKKILKYLGY